MRSLYIAGRMHCGSTFLNVLLGAADGAFAIGELVNGLKRGRGEQCACGEALADCPVWRAAAAEYHARTGRDVFEDGKWLYEQAGIDNFLKAYRASESDAPWATYCRIQRDVFAAIGAATGASVGIDSSKEFTRALLTLKSDPEAKVIHLVRKPVAIVGSYYWRQTKGSRFYFMKRSYDLGMFRFPGMMLVAASWNVGAVAGYLLERLAPGRVLQVSYEAFCSDPAAELQRIGAFAGLDMTDTIAKIANGAAFPLHHALGGNEEIRGDERTFTFVPNAAGRRTLPWGYRVAVGLLSAPGRAFQTLVVGRG